jgi:hypothetical protein
MSLRHQRRLQGSAMRVRADFTSQAYFRNPAAALAKLRAAGPVVEVRFPFVGTVWTTTTQELANQVLRDGETFTLRKEDGDVVGLQWWMPKIVRAISERALRALFERWPKLELAIADSSLRWRRRAGLRAIERLPVMAGH